MVGNIGQRSWIGLLARPYRYLQQNYYLFKSWLWEISVGKFMTILDLWYLIAKSSKNFTGSKENASIFLVKLLQQISQSLKYAGIKIFHWLFNALKYGILNSLTIWREKKITFIFEFSPFSAQQKTKKIQSICKVE